MINLMPDAASKGSGSPHFSQAKLTGWRQEQLEQALCPCCLPSPWGEISALRSRRKGQELYLKPSCVLNMTYRQCQAAQQYWHNSCCHFAFVYQVPEKVGYFAINLVICSNTHRNSLFQFCFYEPYTALSQALTKPPVSSYIWLYKTLLTEQRFPALL